MSFEEKEASRGFTILELLLTLIAITLATTLSIQAFFSRAEITLENAAHLLVEDLRLAQARAAYLHVPVEVVFHADGGGYQVQDTASSLPPDEAETRRYSRDAIFEDVRIGHTLLGPGRRVLFDASGRPTSDASITLVFRGESRTALVRASDATVVLADGTR